MDYFTVSVLLLLAAVAIAIFHRWISSRTDFSRDEVIKSWDVFIKLIAAVVAIIGGLFAIPTSSGKRCIILGGFSYETSG